MLTGNKAGRARVSYSERATCRANGWLRFHLSSVSRNQLARQV